MEESGTFRLQHSWCHSSNWSQKSKTRVSYWWRYISLFAHVFSVKTSVHSPTWKLKQNKCTHKCSKKETYHESDDLNRISSREFTCLPLFALLVTHKEKRQSRMPVNLKKTEFTSAGVQAGSSSHTRKRPVREAKFNLKNYTGWNVNSYIYMAH